MSTVVVGSNRLSRTDQTWMGCSGLAGDSMRVEVATGSAGTRVNVGDDTLHVIVNTKGVKDELVLVMRRVGMEGAAKDGEGGNSVHSKSVDCDGGA